MTAPRPHDVVPLRRTAPLTSVQGTLALELEPRQDPPWLPANATSIGAESGPVADVLPIDGRVRRSFEEWARRYAQAAVEIVGGDRPVTQLLRWSSRDVYENLQRRAQLVARAGQHQPGQGRFQPVRPRVLGVHPCFINRDVVEVSTHVRYGERSRALAARFERTKDQRWRCTALEFA